MSAFYRLIRRINRVVKAGLVLGLIMGLMLVIGLAYCWYISGDIEDRFSGRRWSIPSTVYADTTLLFPGRQLNLSFLQQKLQKTGYRKKNSQPQRMGEYRLVGRRLEIYLKDLSLPGGFREGFPAALELENNDCIGAIHRLDTGESLPLLELDPEIIMQFFGKERELRRIVTINEIPRHLIDAVIAAEDSRFYSHYGFDPRGIIRAFYTNLRYRSIRQGGSTLTQQLAKNYFLTPERTVRRKFNELLMALAIELKYDKDEIMEIYLNEIYFGQKGSVSINGAGQAAAFYFDKKVGELTLAEAAMMAGLIKGPNVYSPYTAPERCRERRDQVLRAMHENGLITTAQLKTALDEPIRTVDFEKYYRRAPYFLDYVSRQLEELYQESILSSMGFAIYTTLDTAVQAAAEKALENGLARLEKEIPGLRRDDPRQRLQGAVVVMQPRTGNILAMVGGRDYSRSQFNRVTQARRQPGSCFKPLVTAVLLDGFRPSDLLANRKTTYLINGEPWTPKNYIEIEEEEISLRDMLRLSCNQAAVDMVVSAGPDKVARRLKKFDFSSPLKPYPSIALGTCEVIPLELASAYCVFAADGVKPFPLSVKDVVDEKGKILVQRHMDIKSVISPAKAFLMNSMLQSVVKDGTARSLEKMGFTFPLAGKTGTTSHYRDAWFIGYTPDFLALVWVGFDNGDSVLATGSAAALPVFAELVKNMPAYISHKRFTIPPGVVQKKVCRRSGELAHTSNCPETYEEYFLEENQPQILCPLHNSPGAIRRFFRGVTDFFH